MTDYEKQANDFLANTNTSFTAELIGIVPSESKPNWRHFKYKFTLERGNRVFASEFTACYRDFEDTIKAAIPKHRQTELNRRYELEQLVRNAELRNGAIRTRCGFEHFKTNKLPDLSAYDVLACLTKYDPGTFEQFCSEYGYDTDIRKATTVYQAVRDEWQNVAMLFNDDELEILREIQ